jgi:hypothetical protein
MMDMEIAYVSLNVKNKIIKKHNVWSKNSLRDTIYSKTGLFTGQKY